MPIRDYLDSSPQTPLLKALVISPSSQNMSWNIFFCLFHAIGNIMTPRQQISADFQRSNVSKFRIGYVIFDHQIELSDRTGRIAS